MIGTMMPYGVYAPWSCRNRTSMPRIRPSSSKPTRTKCTWPRSWALDTKCSRRSSVHFTSRPSSRAAHGMRISSGHGCTILTPKPPPTSGAITSTSAGGRSSLAAIALRTLVEVCVDEYTRSDSSSPSHPAYTPPPSSGDETVDVESAGHIDVGDAGVRVRGPDERGGQRVAAEVVEVPALAQDQPRV